MTVDLSQLSVSELESIVKKAESLIEDRRDETVEQAYKQAVELARSVHLTLEELVEFGSSKRKKVARKPVEPRYRNPENHNETWTGRGKQPRWLATAIENGKKLEDFTIG